MFERLVVEEVTAISNPIELLLGQILAHRFLIQQLLLLASFLADVGLNLSLSLAQLVEPKLELCVLGLELTARVNLLLVCVSDAVFKPESYSRSSQRLAGLRRCAESVALIQTACY